MSFSSLPTETHSLICEFAVDQHDRRTHLLCLVSKYFRDIAEPILYRILFVAGRSRATLLARTLAERPDLASHARHIFMADRGPRDPIDDETMPDFAFSFPVTQEGRLERRRRLHSWLAGRERRLASFCHDAREILSRLAPFLRSLVILQYTRCEPRVSVLHEVLKLPFPGLEELTIRGNYPSFPPSLSLPALRRLQLAAGEVPNPWASFTVIAEQCPRLTHLRITEPVSSVSLAIAIEVAYGLREYNHRLLYVAPAHSAPKNDAETSPAPPPRLPCSLKRFLVQPGPLEMSATGVVFPDYQEMTDRLRRVAERFKELELIPPADRNDLPYSLPFAQLDWLDKMQGGEGCWR